MTARPQLPYSRCTFLSERGLAQDCPLLYLCRYNHTSKFSQEPPACRHAGLVDRALGVSLNLRVSPAATPTSRSIYHTANYPEERYPESMSETTRA